VTVDGVALIAQAGLVAIVPGSARHSVKAHIDGQAIIVDYSLSAILRPPGLEHAKAGEAGIAPRISSSSQFFTYFYHHLTHALFGSSMFLSGLIQVAARIRGSP
jgi:hypothetical protein